MAASTKLASTKPRLRTLYNETVAADIKKQFDIKNVNEVPKLEKIVVNVGLGKKKDDKRVIETAKNTLTKITGQAPIEAKAKKSIAGFKLREGQVIGLKVTLRDERMYEFYDRLVSVVIPRLRDFHGLPINAFDGQGNYSIGLKDQSIFPELGYEDTIVIHGLQINIITTGSDKHQSHALLAGLGMPFEKKELK